MDTNRGPRNEERRYGIGLRHLIFPLLLLSLVIHPMGSEPRAQGKPILAIFPFVAEKVEDPSRGAVCPVCRGIHRSSEIPPGVLNAETGVLYAKVEALGAFNVFPLEKVEEAFSKRDQDRSEAGLVPSLIKLGKALSANFIMVGFFFRFDFRIRGADLFCGLISSYVVGTLFDNKTNGE